MKLAHQLHVLRQTDRRCRYGESFTLGHKKSLGVLTDSDRTVSISGSDVCVCCSGFESSNVSGVTRSENSCMQFRMSDA